MSHFEPERYIQLAEDLKGKYECFPSTVSIETLALCNAYCSFCPYHRGKRKGSKLPDSAVRKIIDDFSLFPDDTQHTVILSRVNEPFLDKRWFDIAISIYEKKSNFDFGFFTNGSTLTKEVVRKLSNLPVKYLNISLNYSSEEEYLSSMRLSFQKTTQHMDYLHKQKQENLFQHEVLVSRVGTGDHRDVEFRNFVGSRYPLFRIKVEDEVPWLIDLKPLARNIHSHIPCRQWYTVHILADGTEGFCCIDSEGSYGSGNIYERGILDLYTHPTKRKAREAASRSEVDLCRHCTFMP